MKNPRILTQLRFKARDRIVFASRTNLSETRHFDKLEWTLLLSLKNKSKENRFILCFLKTYVIKTRSKTIIKWILHLFCAKREALFGTIARFENARGSTVLSTSTGFLFASSIKTSFYTLSAYLHYGIFKRHLELKNKLLDTKVVSLRTLHSFCGEQKKDKVIAHKGSNPIPFCFCYIRPLLDFKRETITIVCKDFKIPIYPDQSNTSLQYSRNRIRKQIIPSLKYFMNPNVEDALFKTAELLNKEQFFLYSVLKNSSTDARL